MLSSTPPRHRSHISTSALVALLLLLVLLMMGCTRVVKERPVAKEAPRTVSVTTAESKDSTAQIAAEDTLSAVDESRRQAAAPVAKPAGSTPAKSSPTASTVVKNGGVDDTDTNAEADAILLYYGEVDNEDSASAVDDAVWRMFDLAEEYQAMGVIANREASWEEAQYYFEKGLKILARLDIEESDSVDTPEATKYNSLLREFVSEYRVTLRSLGELQGDVTPSVLLERFGELENRLGADSMRVFAGEGHPITYDLPVKMNDRVKSSIIYFQTVANEAFYKYLGRSKKYDRLFRETLRKHGLPEDLVYLSLVESGFNPRAYSWARASGLWQFISSTGRLYGLDRSWWHDERRDPVKSTDAACRFLKDLYEKFGDWELAMAAYNGGPGRVERTIKSQGTKDFWKLKLKRQTMDYVPLIYAAAIIAKDPERYGFTDIQFEPELMWDEVTISRCLDLKIVAREVGCTVDELKELNPELLRNNTPPNYKNYRLKIPAGKKDTFLAAYDKMPSPKETSWVQHKISRGESVSSIASKYGVSQYAIFEANNLDRRSHIYAGKTLIVPVPLDRGGSEWSGSSDKTYEADGSIYTVRSGDTMWDIARAFSTSVDELRRVNYIERGSRIYVGQKLKLPTNSSKSREQSPRPTGRTYASTDNAGSAAPSGTVQAGGKTYKVRSGDTLWDIARKFGTTTSRLRSLNSLGRSSRIYPGQTLTVSGSAEFVIYKVRRGDTLSRIAQKYSTSIARILATNRVEDPDNLTIGDELKIYLR